MQLRSSMLRHAARLTAIVLAAGILGEGHLSTGSARAAETHSVLPVSGIYRYAVHGSECASVTVFQYCRNFPAQANLVVSRTSGTITVEFDLSSDHLEASRFAIHPDGRYLTWQRTKLTFGISQDDAEPTVPPTLALPTSLSVGLHWTQRFTIGGLPVDTTNQVTRQTVLKIGGASVETYEIDAASQTGGAHPGTETEVTWHAPDSGLDVRLTVHRRIGGVFPYKMDLDATLLSLRPVR
jgi:hypothetical protein